MQKSLFLFFVPIVIFFSIINCQPDTTGIKAKGLLMDEQIYKTRFIDFRNSSFIPLTSNAEGKISWANPLQSSEHPRFLLLLNNNIIVESLNDIVLFSDTGIQLLNEVKAYGSFITIKGDNIYFLNKDYQLQTLDKTEKLTILNEYLPEAPDDKFPVSIIVPQEQNYLAVVQSLGGVHEPPPQVFVNKTNYGDGLSTWEQEYEGVQKLYPIYEPKQKRIIVFINETIIIDSESGNEIKKIPYPLDNPIACSADVNGNLYFAGTDNNKTMLISESINGDIIWRSEEIQTEFNSKIICPPIIGDKIQFVLSSFSLKAFETGKFIWTFDKPDLEFKYCSALADGTTLLTTNNLIFHLDESGKVMFELDLKDKILTPPIVNSKGEILIATDKNLICIN